MAEAAVPVRPLTPNDVRMPRDIPAPAPSPTRGPTVPGDDWPEEVARLWKELDGDTGVYGSRRLSQSLIEMGLVARSRAEAAPVRRPTLRR